MKKPLNSGINRTSNSLSDKCVINLGYYDCVASNVKELMQNLASYAINNGLTLEESGIIIGGWSGNQYGTTIVTFLSYMINVTFIGTDRIYIGYVTTTNKQCIKAWSVGLTLMDM